MVFVLFCFLSAGPASFGRQLNAERNTRGNKNNATTTAINSSPASGITAAISTTQAGSGFRVGVDDELMISIWHEPELSQAAVVRSDGMITMPLLNDIKVAGLTTEEIQALLTQKLKPVVNDPQVTVIVKTVKSRRVFLVGAAAKQGAYPLTDQLTTLELIAEAGGLGPFAKSGAIYILRDVNGSKVRLRFDYKKALSGRGGGDVLLQSGDMVIVP